MYTCQRCNKVFRQKGDLRRHLLRKKLCFNLGCDLNIEEYYCAALGEDYPEDKNRKIKKSNKSKSKKVSKSSNLSNLSNLSNVSNISNISNLSNLSNLSKKTDSKGEENNISKNYHEKLHIENTNYIIKENDKEVKKNITNLNEDLKEMINNVLYDQELHECPKCGCGFSRKDNLKVHMERYCKNNNTVMQLEADKLAQQKIIDELRLQMALLLEQLSKKTTNNTTNIQNNYIVLNAFGKENINYIDENYIKCLIKSGPFSCIPKLLKAIHFDPKHKENHNIKIPNKKKSFAKIFNGIDWEFTPKQKAIENMTDKAFDIINKHYDEGENHYMDQFQEKYDSNDAEVHNKLMNDTEVVILNNQ